MNKVYVEIPSVGYAVLVSMNVSISEFLSGALGDIGH